MDYRKIYKRLVEYRKENAPTGYTETHHILPRSLGGTDEKANLVVLTAREHFMAHLLLTKLYKKKTQEWYKMCHAVVMMLTCSSSDQERFTPARRYEQYREAAAERMSQLQSGENHSQYGKMWVHNKQLRLNKKISKSNALEPGWEKGRVTDWDNYWTDRYCDYCETNKVRARNSRFCSDDCKTKHYRKKCSKRAFGPRQVNPLGNKKCSASTPQVPVKTKLVGERGHACEVCGISSWLGVEVPIKAIKVDRYDFQIMCNNCASLYKTNSPKLDRDHRIVPDEQIIEAIQVTYTTRQTLVKLNMFPAGANYNRIKKLKEQHCIKHLGEE